MSSDDSFNSIWSRSQREESLVQPARKEPCSEAVEFRQKINETIFSVIGERPTHQQIALAKYVLQEEWHTWRSALPSSHRRSQLPEFVHPCLDDTYHELYSRLRLLEKKIELAGLAPKPPPPRFPNLSIPRDFSLGVTADDLSSQLGNPEPES